MSRRLPVGTRAAWLFAPVFAAVLLGRAAPANADITLGFVGPDSCVAGDTLTVLVTVDDQATDLRGFSLVVKFRPDIVVDVRPGSLLLSSGCPYFLDWLNPAAVAAGDSLIAVDGAGLGCSLTGPGDIVQLDFICEPPGPELPCEDQYPISCDFVELRDSLNQSLDLTCIPGNVCQGPISVTPTSWGRVKAWYGGSGSPR